MLEQDPKQDKPVERTRTMHFGDVITRKHDGAGHDLVQVDVLINLDRLGIEQHITSMARAGRDRRPLMNGAAIIMVRKQPAVSVYNDPQDTRNG